MRSLVTASTRFWDVTSAQYTVSAFDVEHYCAYVLSKNQGEIEIFRIASSRELPVSITKFASNGRVVSLRYLSETQSLAIVTEEGDIGIVSVEEGASNHFEVIGSIDSGINAVGWCPDESSVAIVTGDEKLLLMSNSFDVLLEHPLHSDESGEAQQVNVGWGSKQTQFHGSLGKAAAQASPTSLASIGSSPDDDGKTRVSWRGDGAFFVVSALKAPRADSDERTRRVLRIYDRQGILQNVAEPVAGLEHVLDWRPSGNLIAGTQRFGFEGGGAGKTGRHDLVFFERNGLRHGEFSLREQGNYKVRELLWNADSDILAVWIEKEAHHLVQLWTTGNYHWYLKQEIMSAKNGDVPVGFSSVTWHPENGTCLLATTQRRIIEYTFAWETLISRVQAPIDTGSVAVVDGTSLLITPFRTQNVPPPMASCVLDLNQPRTPIHVCFASAGDHLAVLRSDESVSLWNMRTRINFGRGKVLEPAHECTVKLDLDGCEPRQIILQEKPSSPKTFRITCLAAIDACDITIISILADNPTQGLRVVEMPGADGRLIYSEAGIYWQSSEGRIFSVTASQEPPELIGSFPSHCFTAEAIALSDNSILFVGRAETGQLYCTSPDSKQAYLLATNSTSITISSGFVIYTTSTHEVFFAPLEKLRDMVNRSADSPSSETLVSHDQPQLDRRRVERGSRIVTAVPSNMCLVLQMPRGNLETINPRPMVLAAVEQDIKAQIYRKAFLACRKHRVDLAILVEYDPVSFLENIPSFVEQINDVDYLNLFLTGLGQSSLEPSRISQYCDALRMELELKDLTKYVNTILTAYVVKKPADYEAALSLLLRIREINADLVEEAVKYIIFLVDADKLYDMALGMYDFSLVLLIAQHSQRDPREYLPFLRELRALPKFYQRYRIDDHLRRYTKALQNLSFAGREYFEEATVYIERHRLHHDALHLWKNDKEHHKRVLDLYGNFLFERRDFRQAALVFMEAQNAPKAVVAYERALLWREALELAIREGTEETVLSDLAHRLADELLSKKKYEEAAQVLLGHAKSVRQCINALVQGNLFSEARRIVALHGEQSLLEEIVEPALLDSRAQIAEDLEEMRVQMQKQIERLRELRVKKAEEPDAFYGLEDDPTLHNVDVMTDVSMAPTAFTRYTAAPTTTSRASKRTSRSKRKLERKVGSGRKGTIDEEEYLLKSLGKLTTRLNDTQSEATQLIFHLLQFTPEHRREVYSLQCDLSTFRTELQATLDEIWPATGGEVGDASDELAASSWAERMEERRTERKRAVDGIVKPELGSIELDWKLDILDL